MSEAHAVPADVVRTVPEGTVVYGLQLPIQSQSSLYVAEWETKSGPDELARAALAAEAAGFFSVGVCDHTAIPERLAQAMGTVWYDTVATLGWLAGVTSDVRLLSHVLVLAQRHPLRAAKELATLDALSGGRLIVGVGAGHVPEEYAPPP
jgi:alkanesulfonate monooxygenase SsuD/methylene tetrahydromethanopterin reductase-like flavin-dependent oxidoreductase (luciferase family)